MGQILFGKLRRDVMILAHSAEGDDATDMKEAAEAAIRQGRAEEVFVVEASFYMAASGIAWGNIDAPIERAQELPSSVPLLNPGSSSAQESLDVPDVEVTSVRNEIRKAAEDGPKGPDTGLADQLKRESTGGSPIVADASGKAPKANEQPLSNENRDTPTEEGQAQAKTDAKPKPDTTAEVAPKKPTST